MDCVLIGGAEGDRFAVFRDLIESTFSLKAIQATTFDDIIRFLDEEAIEVRLVLLPEKLQYAYHNKEILIFQASFRMLNGAQPGRTIGRVWEKKKAYPDASQPHLNVPYPNTESAKKEFLIFLGSKFEQLRLPTLSLDESDRSLREQVKSLGKDSNLEDGKSKLRHLLGAFLSGNIHLHRLRSGLSGAVVFRVQVGQPAGQGAQFLLKLSTVDWKLREEAHRHEIVKAGIKWVREYIPKLRNPKTGMRDNGKVVSWGGWHAICYEFLGGEKFGPLIDLQEALIGESKEILSNPIATPHPSAQGLSDTDRFRATALDKLLVWLQREWCANDVHSKRETQRPWRAADAEEGKYDCLPPYCLTGQAKGWILDFVNGSEAQIGKRLLPEAWETLTSRIERFTDQKESYGVPKLDKDMSMILSPAHGDLNANNVLFFFKLDDPIFLIDFPMYQECGHALQDFARLEIEIKYALMDRQQNSPPGQLAAFDLTSSQFQLWCELEEHLQAPNWEEPKQWSSAGFHDNVYLSWYLVREVRRAARSVQRRNLKADESPHFEDEYLCPLLYHTLRSITYKSLSIFKRLLAVYSSAKLLERAGFTEAAQAATVDSK